MSGKKESHKPTNNAEKRIGQLTSKRKFRHSKNKHQKREIKIDENDSRFAEFSKPIKRPPVDMYGRPVSQDALEKYESSSDEEIESYVPKDAIPSDDDEQPMLSEKYSKRIAVVDQPWKEVSAQDIFEFIYHTLGEHNVDLNSVVVYLSRYGQENPETECPPPNDDEDIETGRWRKRERNSMKRHFAVCEFKDKDIALIAYKGIDSIGLDDTNSIFNLQFIDDEIQFDDFTKRDEANCHTDDWNPPQVYCPFLNKTKNKDDWDSSTNERNAAFKAVWEQGSDEEIGASLILGSGSEDEERPTRDALQDVLNAMHQNEEEEEMKENDDDDEHQLDVQFVQGNEQLEKEQEQDAEKAFKSKKQRNKKDEITAIGNEDETVREVMADDRFKELFAKPGYGIDTADPNFKRTPMMEKYMEEMSKKHMNMSASLPDEGDSAASQMESTVERLRRRAEANAKANAKASKK